MWDERFAETCARHADLVAVFESAHGRLGLLLRQTLVPLDAERLDWLGETRAVARHIITDLRAVGFSGGAVVLQWLPVHDVARIVGRWVRRWDGDPVRRSQLLAVVERRLMDERYLAARRAHGTSPVERPTATPVIAGDADAPAEGFNEAGLDALKAWYEAMAPCWLAIQPARRRRLVLQSHVWIADHALADPVEGPRRAAAELGRDGSLVRALDRLVPRAQAAPWRAWIDLVRTDLARALARPPARRTQAWARWLFLIPYSVPVPHRSSRAPRSGGAPAPSAWTSRPWRAKMEA